MTRRTQAERRAATRASLLDAARTAFAQRGFHGTSLDHVTALAGCTKGALYDHFGSKEGLFLALLDEHVAGRLDQASAAGVPSEAMPFDRDFALLFLEFVCAAGRDEALRQRLAAGLSARRAEVAERLGDARAAAIVGTIANGASIEALVFGELEAAATFDAALAAALRESN